MPHIRRCLAAGLLAAALMQAPAAGGCIGDANGDGVTDVEDLVAVILNYDCVSPPPCAGDANFDGQVNVQDLITVIVAWGTCTLPTGACCMPGGTCSQLPDSECAAAGGLYQGEDVLCTPGLCPSGPGNDTCAGAIRIGVGGSIAGTTLEAGPDGVPLCGPSVTAAGVWYSVIGTGTTLFATTCTDVFDFDTKISVYCGTCNSLVCVTGNDDACFNGASSLLSTAVWCAAADVEYFVLVHGFSAGDFVLEVFDDAFPCTPIVSCAPTGVCCIDKSCVDSLTEEACLGQGGFWQGAETTCDPSTSYSVTSCGAGFEDVSLTGTEAPNASSHDDAGDVVSMGFTFTFFGIDHQTIGISSNGYLTFGSDLDDQSNDRIPSPAGPDDLIAPWWDDWNPAAGGTVHYQTKGTAPVRRFIAQWTAVPHFGGTGAATFQAILRESSGEIEFRYGVPLNLNSPTVGVESPDGSEGLSINGAGILPGDCLLILPQASRPIDCEG